jgi:serine protease Do
MSRFTPPSRGLRLTLIAVLLAGTALGGYAAGHESFAATTTTEPGASTGSDTAIHPQASPTLLPDFSNLVTEVKPAVVSITTKLKPGSEVADQDNNQQQSPFPFPFPFGPNQQQRQEVVEARGSGFIINANGTVVTNNHVVKDAQSVSVTLDDGTTLPARIVGTDPGTDLAVLRINAGHPLPYLDLGDSNDVKVGQWVVAMGNPFGLGGTVTAGIVSARGRDIGDGPYDSFIQTDAPINEGNSGGPLFTQQGKVIGINTAILSPSGGSVGIGFAIPSNTIREVVAQLVAHGHVTRGYLGVEAQGISSGMAAALHLPNSNGALIASIEPNSPASNAGLQPGDVITSVDGKAVDNPRDLAIDVAAVAPDHTATFDVVHNGQSRTLSVKVATLQNQVASNGGNGAENSKQGIGVALEPLTPDVRNQLNVPDDQSGAVVAQVQSNSPAATAGIQAGDIIVGVGTQSVGSPAEAVHQIRDALQNGHVVALRIVRNGQSIFVAVSTNNNQGQG